MDIKEQVAEMLPEHPLTGLRALAVLGSGRAVWPVRGAEKDDDSDGDGGGDDAGQDDDSDDGNDGGADDDGDGSGDGGDDQDGGGKDEGLVSRAELRKVIKERQAAKAALRKSEQELAQLKQANESDTEKAVREAAEAAAAQEAAKYKPISVKAALLEAGVKGGRIKGALKLVDMDQIEVDADGEVTGIDDQIDLLKEDWPELFADPDAEKKTTRRTAGSKAADGADKKPAAKKEMTATERQAAALLGKG